MKRSGRKNQRSTGSVNAVPQREGSHEYEAVKTYADHGAVPLLDPIEGMSEAKSLHIATIIPPFRRGSGGHGTIFKILRRLEARGHTCTVWLNDHTAQHRADWPARLRGDIVEFFGPLNAPVYKGFDEWFGADVVMPTGWQTAHPAVLLGNARARAYMVNDYEPMFFGASAERLWATETYDLGMHCIAASPWLRDLLITKHGCTANDFTLGVEQEIYRPLPLERRDDTVVFYARTITDRRGCELAFLAIAELKRRRPDLRVVLFGEEPGPATSFEYENLGVATPRQLASLYNEATVGLSISLTNFSLIPKEMLACGLPCVEIAGISAESIFGADGGPLSLVPPDPLAIATELERLLDDRALRESLARDGVEFTASETWELATDQVEQGLRQALRTRES